MSDLEKAIAIARGDTPEGRNWAYLSMKDRDTVELGIRRLSSAGYHLLSDADLQARDNAVLERAAEKSDQFDTAAAGMISKAIRAMSGG